ncbi:family 2 encapsulin nanocompartment cargo protein terpene cyclase [Streptomyces sp. NPDC001594]|uniref:family 2 encapsulin nanocompartment cargo protein terpene cyclase n=1 Tax=Streptomyces sp. NPDC001594 TaxID=3364590 RepID=UPI0036AB824D
MPDPGPSPLQPGPPAPAARFGAPALADALAPVRADGAAAAAAVLARALPSRPVLPFGTAPAPEAQAPDPPAPAEAAHSPAALERILRGPAGLGTEALHWARPAPPPATAEAPAAPEPPAPAEMRPIPGLYHHPVPEPDPVRVAELSRRIKAWAVDEVQAFPAEWEDQFDGFSVSRYMVACHPDAPTLDHLMLAARLMVAENVVDDAYCEDGATGPDVGGLLLMAHTALDPVHTTQEYRPAWEESLSSDAARRSYHSAMGYFTRLATPAQADRFRHDMSRLHMGYLAEAAWDATEYVPEVWEYLAMRQFNNFRPCPTITDSVGGYELPAELHALPAMQRVIALAGNATTLSNDLYSYMKELKSPGKHLNLPVVLAEKEGLSDKEAYLKAVEVHNELMHEFEAESAALTAACPDPRVARFLKGVAAWVDGNHYWHASNTYRYTLPDFW